MWDTQFYTIALVTILAVISPGPDFAIILRNSISFGRIAGCYTALGIAAGVSVHITYTVLGFSYLMNEALWLLDAMRYIGAAYLIWLGVSAFLSQTTQDQIELQPSTISALASFRNGVICNALNPKTALFFIALFTQVVDPHTPIQTQMGFGLFIALAHLLWFSCLAYLLTHQAWRNRFHKIKPKIERVVGACLLILGIKLMTTT
ncbi:MAG: LysE family transporter [Methylocystaceae bacterium]|nr:LysE family transporter [Methylocystaceae bacterium]